MRQKNGKIKSVQLVCCDFKSNPTEVLCMATTQDTNRRSDVIRCEYCGEDYSVTYKRCPFCEGKAGLGGMTSGRGGKRVATNKRGGGYGGGMEPVQIIGLVLSLILIAAAIYIVYTVLSPLFSRGTPSGSDVSVSVSQSEGASLSGSGDVSASVGSSSSIAPPDVSTPVTPPDVSTPVTPPPSGSGSGVITPIITATGITLAKTDVTLKADEPYKIVATLAPAGCTDTITWTSSNESAATVTQDGTVTNVNKGNSQVSVTITARVGDVSAVCTVRCKPGSTGGSSSGTTVTTGTTGTVTGTSTGLYVRTSPSTSATPKESLLNGTQVTIVEDTGSGWYKINYSGNGGKIESGYVSKDYIKTN